jgi:hypothetical protein
MKSQGAIAYFVFAAAIGFGTIGLRSTWAQERKSGEWTREVKIVVPDGEEIRRSVEHSLAAAGLDVGNSIDAKIRKAAEKLRDAKDEQTKTEAREKLAGLLGQYFDEDMTRREKELAKLKERLEKLTAQLERRRAKKQDIIDLQIQVAVNEADGLGFISRPANWPFGGDFNFHYGAPPVHVSTGDAYVPMPPMPPTPPNPHPHGESDATGD